MGRTVRKWVKSMVKLIFCLKSNMNSLAFVLVLAGAFAAANADIGDIIGGIGDITDGIGDIVDVHNGNANEYADEILKNLRVRILNKGLDPLILPVKSFEFSKKVLLVEVRGSAKVYDGYLKGLSTIHRTGLADMTTNATHVRVRATIGVNDLYGSYKASAKFMNLGPSFGLNLAMESVGITFEVVQATQKGSRPHLLSFAIVDLGEITTEIDGNLGILDFFLNKFNNFVVNLLKDFVVTALEFPLKKLVQNILDTVDLPDLTATKY